MRRRGEISAFGAVLTIVVCVLAISITWAAYSSSLVISNSQATIEKGVWSVIFTDLNTTPTVYSTASTAKALTTPKITNDTTIENISVSLATVGDYVSYDFKIKNAGTFPAKIVANSGSSFVIPKTCEQALDRTYGTTTITDANITTACNAVTVTLTYVGAGSNFSAGSNVGIGNLFPKTGTTGSEVTARLKITYSTAVSDSVLTDDVRVKVGPITIPFVQA